jgi:hypothetical protein
MHVHNGQRGEAMSGHVLAPRLGCHSTETLCAWRNRKERGVVRLCVCVCARLHVQAGDGIKVGEDKSRGRLEEREERGEERSGRGPGYLWKCVRACVCVCAWACVFACASQKRRGATHVQTQLGHNTPHTHPSLNLPWLPCLVQSV